MLAGMLLAVQFSIFSHVSPCGKVGGSDSDLMSDPEGKGAERDHHVCSNFCFKYFRKGEGREHRMENMEKLLNHPLSTYTWRHSSVPSWLYSSRLAAELPTRYQSNPLQSVAASYSAMPNFHPIKQQPSSTSDSFISPYPYPYPYHLTPKH